MKDIEKHLTELQNRITRHIESNKDKENKKEKEINSLKDRIAKINPIESKLGALEKKITFELSEQLNRNLNNIDLDFDRLAEKNQELKQRLAELEKQGVNEKIKKVSKDLEKQIGDVHGKISNLFEKIGQFENINVSQNLKELEEQIKNIMNDLAETAKKEDVLGVENEIESLQKNLNEKLSETVTNFENKLTEKAKAHNFRIDKSFSELEEQITDITNRLAEIEALNLNTEMAKKEEILEVGDKIHALHEHIEVFDNSIKNSKENVTQLKELLKDLHETLDKKLVEASNSFENKLNEKSKAHNSRIDKSFSELEETRSEIWELVKTLDDFKQNVKDEFRHLETTESENNTKINAISESTTELENKLKTEVIQRVIKLEETHDFDKGEFHEFDKRIERVTNELEENHHIAKKQREDVDLVTGKVYELNESQKKMQNMLNSLEKKEAELRMNLLWAKKFKEEFEELKNKTENDFVMLPEFNRLKQSYETIWSKLGEQAKTNAQVTALKDSLVEIKGNIQDIKSEISKNKVGLKEITEKTKELPTVEEQEKQNEKALKEYKELFEKRNIQLLEMNNKLEQVMVKIFSVENDQEKVKDSMKEIREIEDELKETMAEIKKYEIEKYNDKLRELDVNKAGRKEFNTLQDAFESTKQKNAELIEMLLEKLGM